MIKQNNVFLILLLSACLITSPAYCGEVNQMNSSNDKAWFANHDCQEVTIQHHKKAENKIPTKSKTITDSETIQTMVNLIEKMPIDGDIYVSFSSSVSVTKAIFKCADHTSVIEFYNGKVKTPGTSFYAREVPEESVVFKKLMDLL